MCRSPPRTLLPSPRKTHPCAKYYLIEIGRSGFTARRNAPSPAHADLSVPSAVHSRRENVRGHGYPPPVQEELMGTHPLYKTKRLNCDLGVGRGGGGGVVYKARLRWSYSAHVARGSAPKPGLRRLEAPPPQSAMGFSL